MPCDDVYSCNKCGNFFATREDFDLHHEQKAHEDAVRLKPLFSVDLKDSDRCLAFFGLTDEFWQSSTAKV